MDAPCVLVASATQYDPKELVKQILDVSQLPSAEPVIEQIEAYPWHLDTKYYTADINICTTPNRTIGNEEFAENVQGFVLYFDSSEEDGLMKAGFWIPFVRAMEPAVQILACERCFHNGVTSKLVAQKWCLENGFELVELNPEEDSDSEDDEFQETTGVKRIIQALHAHTWSNLTMKDKPSFRSPYMTQMMMDSALERLSVQQSDVDDSSSQTNVPTTGASNSSSLTAVLSAIAQPNDPSLPLSAMQHSITDATQTVSEFDSIGLTDSTCTLTASTVDSNIISETNKPESDGAVVARDGEEEGATGGTSISSNTTATSSVAKSKAEKDLKNRQRKSGVEIIDSMVPDSDMALFSALGNDDPCEESFEQLFEKMRLMKERAEALPPDQRKLYAEKIAIQFWRAIEGDEDEIEGLSSSEEEPQI